jgi:hypothetical protein
MHERTPPDSAAQAGRRAGIVLNLPTTKDTKSHKGLNA